MDRIKREAKAQRAPPHPSLFTARLLLLTRPLCVLLLLLLQLLLLCCVFCFIVTAKQLSSEDLLTDEPDTGAVQDGNDNDDSLLNQHSQDNLDLEKTLTPPDPASCK